MSSKLKKLILFVVISTLIILFTPFFGSLYEKYFGPITSGFIGLSNPQYFEGFFVSYAFFITFMLTLFLNHKKYKTLGIFLGIIFAFDLFIGAWEGLIINLVVVIIAWLLAQIILFISKKLKR